MRSRIFKATIEHKRRLNLRVWPAHRDFIRSLPCLACENPAPVECAHVRMGTDGGTGLKPSDRYCVPLCHGCHGYQHRIGEPAFWSELGVDPVDYAHRLWRVTGDRSGGLRTILRARQAIKLKGIAPG